MSDQVSREEILSQLDEKVNNYFLQSFNCAQSSFAALQEQFGLDGGPILKALTPFPGIALQGETCGVVSGSMMALGLVFGRDRLDDLPGMRAAFVPGITFCRRFTQEVGSTRCGDILETLFGKRFNLTDPAQVAEYSAAGAIEKCGAVTRKGVRIAAEILLARPV
jgi:C_GCAxxG_C_C family probable redox protein